MLDNTFLDCGIYLVLYSLFDSLSVLLKGDLLLILQMICLSFLNEFVDLLFDFAVD